MKNKKCVVLTLVIALIISTFAGCSKKKESSSVSEQNVKTFKEEEVKLPNDVVGRQEKILSSMNYINEKDLEIYTVSQKETTKLYRYQLKDGLVWEKLELEWVHTLEYNLDSNTTYVGYDSNNTPYIMLKDDADIFHIYKSEDGESATEINLDDFDAPIKEVDKYPRKIKVIDSDKLIVSYYERYDVYDLKSGSKLDSISCGFGFGDIIIIDGNILYQNQKKDGVAFYNLDNKNVVKEIPFADDGQRFNFVSDNNKNIYSIMNQGIYMLPYNGNIWEMMADGTRLSLSNLSLERTGIQIIDSTNYYVLCNDKGQSDRPTLIHIVEGISEQKETHAPVELKISSVYANKTIQQAISVFQKQYPYVTIKFTPPCQDAFTSDPRDAIKKINTEILAGNGGDIFIMDELNLNEFKKKGILMDLSEVIKPMMENGEILPNIAQGFMEEDKIYTIPTRIQYLMWMANKDTIKYMASLSDLADFSETYNEKPIFSRFDFLNTAYLEYHNMYNEDGTFNKQGLLDYFNNLDTIINQSKKFREQWDTYDVLDLLAGVCAARYEVTYMGFTSTNFNNQLVKASEDLALGFDNVNYLPYGMISINEQSKNKELALEFVKTVLSYSVQSVDTFEGYPVNSEAVDYCDVKENTFASIYKHSTKSDCTFNYGPGDSELDKITNNVCRQVTKPILRDRNLHAMFVEQLEEHFENGVSIDECVNRIMKNAELYLKE